MQMNDRQRIPAPKKKVWAALNDPEILKKCIPGCQALEMTSPTEMTATVVFRVGPVKATFGGKVAQLGGRLIDSTAKKLAGEFFASFGAVVGGEVEAPAEADGGKKSWLGKLTGAA